MGVPAVLLPCLQVYNALMHMHLRVECANKGQRYYKCGYYSVECNKVHIINKG